MSARAPLYYVGTPAEVEHHARPLAETFDLRIATADEALRLARPGELCVLFNEFFPRFRDACLTLQLRGCPTLYALDGILEWRSSWQPPTDGSACPYVMRPVLSHKVACIGRSQARVLESWGNLGKCEIVGVPRFDALTRGPFSSCGPLAPRTENLRGSTASPRPFRVLILTAKCPGFTPDQVERTRASLRDLKTWFDGHKTLNGTLIEPVWRLTAGLDRELGVENHLADTTGRDLASALPTVDAMIATASTAMLEGMLAGLPVALLDYHNRPHYVPAVWRITTHSQIEPALAEMLRPLPGQMQYQQSILHDALECRTAATPRLVGLATRMIEIAGHCLKQGQPLAFPARLLPDPQLGHHLPDAGNHGGALDVAVERQAEAWHRLLEEADAARSKTALAETAALRFEIEQLRQALQRVERRKLSARLARLGWKISRAIGMRKADKKEPGSAPVVLDPQP